MDQLHTFKIIINVGLPEKNNPAVIPPNIGSFFVFFSGNFLIFREISEIFAADKISCEF